MLNIRILLINARDGFIGVMRLHGVTICLPLKGIIYSTTNFAWCWLYFPCFEGLCGMCTKRILQENWNVLSALKILDVSLESSDCISVRKKDWQWTGIYTKKMKMCQKATIAIGLLNYYCDWNTWHIEDILKHHQRKL